MKKNSLIIVMIITLVISLGGCNTMQGLGRDLESLGGGLEETAEKASY